VLTGKPDVARLVQACARDLAAFASGTCRRELTGIPQASRLATRNRANFD